MHLPAYENSMIIPCIQTVQQGGRYVVLVLLYTANPKLRFFILILLILFKSRLIVEFSLENSEKVNVLRAREQKRKQIAEEASRVAKEKAAAEKAAELAASMKKAARRKQDASRSESESALEEKRRKRREGPGQRRKRLKMERA
jgi:hypothetical protein